MKHLLYEVDIRLINSLLLIFYIPCNLIFGSKNVSQGLVLESNGSILYEDNNQTLIVEGNASLRGENFLTLAEVINWNRKTGEIIAQGSVSVTTDKIRLLADKIHLSLKTGDFIAYQVRGGVPPLVFTSEIMERNGTIDRYRNGDLYLFEPSRFEPNFHTNYFSLDNNLSTYSLGPTTIRVGKLPIAMIPQIRGKRNIVNRGIDSSVTAGKDGSLGWYGGLILQYPWKKSYNQSSVKYYLDRGPFLYQKSSVDYDFHRGFISSELEAGWIRDQGNDIGNDIRGFKIDRQRGYAKVGNMLRFQDRFRSATLLEWESDSEFIRDFRRDHFYKNQWNQNYSEISYEGNGYTISLLTRWQVNPHESTVEQLPLLNLVYGPVARWGVYHSSSLNYSKFLQKNQYNQSGKSVDRANLGYKLDKPVELINGVVLNPSIAILHQDYHSHNSVSRTFLEYGLDLHINFHRNFPYHNRLWEIQELLHRSRFSIGIRSTRCFSGVSKSEVPSIFPQVDDLNLLTPDLIDHQNSEELISKNLFRLGWENSLFGKWNQSSRSLLSTRTYLDLIEPRDDLNKSTFFYSKLLLNPLECLSLSLSNKIDIKSGKNYRQSYSLALNDGRFQGGRISYLTYLNFNHYTQLSLWKRLNENILGYANIFYDHDLDDLAHWNGRLTYDSASSWTWEFAVSQRSGTRNENNTEWSIGVSLSDFNPSKDWSSLHGM